jgi:hypothetical protein
MTNRQKPRKKRPTDDDPDDDMPGKLFLIININNIITKDDSHVVKCVSIRSKQEIKFRNFFLLLSLIIKYLNNIRQIYYLIYRWPGSDHNVDRNPL